MPSTEKLQEYLKENPQIQNVKIEISFVSDKVDKCEYNIRPSMITECTYDVFSVTIEQILRILMK